MTDPNISNATDMWLREVRNELHAIRTLLENSPRPAPSTDAEKPAQPASQGKRALPNPRKS